MCPGRAGEEDAHVVAVAAPARLADIARQLRCYLTLSVNYLGRVGLRDVAGEL